VTQKESNVENSSNPLIEISSNQDISSTVTNIFTKKQPKVITKLLPKENSVVVEDGDDTQMKKLKKPRSLTPYK
jgi:hypothetical protein